MLIPFWQKHPRKVDETVGPVLEPERPNRLQTM